LSFAQADVATSGHAIEARLYAEDPARDFLPTGGTISVYREPAGAGVRVDSGIEGGTVVPTLYDPLLAKVIAHGPDRAQALRRLDRALGGLTLLGVHTNIGFLRRLLTDGDVRAGALDTGLVARHLDQLATYPVPDHALVAAALRHLAARERALGRNAFDLPGGWRLGEPARTVLRLNVGDRTATVGVRGSSAAADVVIDAGPAADARATVDGDVTFVELAGRQRRYSIVEDGDTIWVGYQGAAWALHHQERLQASRHVDAGGGPVVSPLPGTVVAVETADGAAVSAGQVLLVIEAMKMEHQVVAPADGVVANLAVRAGDLVEMGQVLLVVERYAEAATRS
jgi:acetyl-CoA/propionyl-CoA carboxylase biotin carboxyl carrier protein